MENTEKLVDVLNNLIVINNDRVEGYQRAAEETDDYTLKSLFETLSGDSRRYASALAIEVAKLGGKVDSSTSTAGDMYRVWMNFKAAITGQNRESILSSCEIGEDVAKKAYKMALESDAEIPSEIRQLIVSQQDDLLDAHDEVKHLRDTAKAE